jgi:hypothetical protein
MLIVQFIIYAVLYKTDLAGIYIDLKLKSFSKNWQPMNDSDFSKGSLEVFRIVQEWKNQKRGPIRDKLYK